MKFVILGLNLVWFWAQVIAPIFATCFKDEKKKGK